MTEEKLKLSDIMEKVYEMLSENQVAQRDAVFLLDYMKTDILTKMLSGGDNEQASN